MRTGENAGSDYARRTDSEDRESLSAGFTAAPGGRYPPRDSRALNFDRAQQCHAPPSSREIRTGRLEAHGAANYHSSDGSPSYYVASFNSGRGLSGRGSRASDQTVEDSADTRIPIGCRSRAMRVTLPKRGTDRKQPDRTPSTGGVKTYIFAETASCASRSRIELADSRGLRERPELRRHHHAAVRRSSQTAHRDPRDRACSWRVKESCRLAKSVHSCRSAPKRRHRSRSGVAPRHPTRERAD